MKKILLKASVCTLVVLSISACSSNALSDLFSNYNTQMRGVKAAQQQGSFQQAVSKIPQRSQSDGTFTLGILEKARLEYLARNFPTSLQDFDYVYRKTQEEEQAAKLQVSRGVEKVAAVVSNDNAIRYEIPYYEQSMANSYQALNYLNQNDLSGAMVEIRRANLVQNKALKANQKAIDKSRRDMAKQGVTPESLADEYPSMNTVIGNIKNGFQNAYTFYLSGVLYEASNQANDAYIDYKKALEIYPSNLTLQKDVWRLANQLGMTEDIQLYKQRFSGGITQDSMPATSEPKGQVVFIIDQGIITSKQEVSFHLPIYYSYHNTRFFSVALPVYPNTLRHYSGLSLNYQGKQYQSEEIVRLQSLAAKELQDKMPAIVTRQIVRLIAKEEMRQRMSNNNGNAGNIIASLYNIASERADTRSWSTLPDSVHILRMNLTPGQHDLELMINGSKQVINIEVNQDRQTLVSFTSIGQYNNYQSFNL